MSVRQRITGAAARRCAQTLAAVLVLAAGMACAGASPALASGTQKSVLMDDQELIYSPLSHVEKAMSRIRSLGVDTIRVSVVWGLVTPKPKAKHKPKFDASSSNAYPGGAWTRYDQLVQLAQKFGLTVYFQLTAPAPRWATTAGPNAAGTHSWSRLPNPKYFGQFAKAVAGRYSGSFVPPGGADQPPVVVPLNDLTIPPPDPSTQPTTPGALPAVRWWSIWNEPNDQGWLSPQYHRMFGQNTPWSPLQYRNLVDAGYSGLTSTGHAGDTILIGETSSGRAVNTVPFLRDLYCVSSSFRPLGGLPARRLGCPTSGARSAFVSKHPGLFHASGYATHPYFFSRPPNARPGRGILTLTNLGVLRNLLGQVRHPYGQGGSLPIYSTEYGYKTNPPNRYVNTSLFDQEVWLNEGEYLQWRIPWVNSMAQFELVDAKPLTRYPRNSRQYWSTFQTGLMFSNGKPKPSYASFRMPVWVPSQHTGGSVMVWGALRPADHSQAQTGTLQFRTSSRASWGTLETFQTNSPEGYFVEHVSISRPGMIRVAWQNPANGSTDYSRTVPIKR